MEGECRRRLRRRQREAARRSPSDQGQGRAQLQASRVGPEFRDAQEVVRGGDHVTGDLVGAEADVACLAENTGDSSASAASASALIRRNGCPLGTRSSGGHQAQHRRLLRFASSHALVGSQTDRRVDPAHAERPIEPSLPPGAALPDPGLRRTADASPTRFPSRRFAPINPSGENRLPAVLQAAVFQRPARRPPRSSRARARARGGAPLRPS